MSILKKIALLMIIGKQLFATDLKVELANSGDWNISFVERDSVTVIVNIEDNDGNSKQILQLDDLIVTRDGKKAFVTSVEKVEKTTEVSQKIVLVLDNSNSMAGSVVQLKSAMKSFAQSVGNKAELAVVAFNESEIERNCEIDGVNLNLRWLPFDQDVSHTIEEAERFYKPNFMTSRTYLYDALRYAQILLEKESASYNKRIVVLSDGEDRWSKFKENDLYAAQNKDIPVYGVDFTKNSETMTVLQTLAEISDGRVIKVTDAKELGKSFTDISDILTREFIAKFTFGPLVKLEPVSEMKELLVLKQKVMDISPVLNYVFFTPNSFEIPAQYHQFRNAGETEEFKEFQIETALDKYYHILNVVGSRLQANPSAKITLIGCNNNKGEKENLQLSEKRAIAVKEYFQQVWKIQDDRMTIVNRNLPTNASSSKSPEGQQENCRVEILSDFPSILAPVRSYVEELKFSPESSRFSFNQLKTLEDPKVAFVIYQNGKAIGRSYPEIVNQEFSINWGQALLTTPESNLICELIISNHEEAISSPKIDLHVNIQDQTTLTADIENGQATEKFSLTLFPYNSSDIGNKNDELVNNVITRAMDLKASKIDVYGYSDSIGSAEYNLKLSHQRAQKVYNLLLAKGANRGILNYAGYGEEKPLFSNATPEGRFLNRTVQIYLTYPENLASMNK